MNYTGVIIKESLENEDVLKNLEILSTKVEALTERHKTPWVKQWTLYTVKFTEEQVEAVTQKISASLDSHHPWYADFKNNNFHFIIFRNRIFRIDRKDTKQYEEAVKYGLKLGIPSYQLDFSPQIAEWQRNNKT